MNASIPRRCGALWRSATLSSALALVFTTPARAGCPTATIEAIQGSGYNQKVGFECGTGCNKKFYLVSGANSFTKCTSECWTRIETGCGTFEDYTRIEKETASGSSISVIVVLNPQNCATTVTSTYSGSSMERASYYNETYASVCQIGVQISSCESFSVDGNAVDPGNSCGALDCGDTTGYTLVSSTSSADACGGTTTKEVWKLVTDSGRCVITTETSSTPGYKSEYTTQMAISRARTCAMNQLAQKSLPEGDGINGRALCSFALASDRSSASVTVARWRIRIEGTSADEDYRLDLTWLEVVNGKARRFIEKRTVSGSDQPVWYYPSEEGELLKPKESQNCGYTYSKELVGVTITPR